MLTLIRVVSSHIFKKAIHSHDVAVITRSCSALKITLNEAFNNSLQNDHKISKLLLSSDKLNLNYTDFEGNSILKNIVESQNTSLLNKYFSKVSKEPCVKLENKSIIEAFDSALKDQAVLSTFLNGLAKLNKLDQLQTQSSSHNYNYNIEEVATSEVMNPSAPPPAYEDIKDSSILGETIA